MELPKNLLSFAEASKKLPLKNGRRLNVSTVWRWARKGVGGITLQTWKLGGQFYTTLQALDDFGKACAEAPTSRNPRPNAGRPKGRTKRQFERDQERAKSVLAAAGI